MTEMLGEGCWVEEKEKGEEEEEEIAGFNGWTWA